ncbi:enterochelin esterase-like enzyme [Kitasatospora sp. MAA19]|uniref:alpha/beta hydrolase n=1 Tax=unclassified Kitasatospora TaxID=2633591 RepID=UPI002473CFC9|nr:alpha/beta hydrolase-fold protein [Kitasatospora sp. MAA19]MDH6704032.1 enterochelin esterase-like enzyme [Kitasatospora sp. MAA19]
MLSLTGLPLQIVTSAVAILVFAATMWLWPRFGGKGWKSWAGRIGAFLATQVAVLVAMGLIANGYFGFYSSWSDLLGTNGKLGTVVDHTPNAALSITGEQSFYSAQGSDRERSGLIQKVAVKGAATGLSGEAYVYLPPQYFQPAYAKQQFPMALVLTGYPGTPEKLISLMQYPASALTAIEQKKLPPTILVMTRPTLVGNRDTECVDVPNGPQAETYFTSDLPKALATAYRIGSAPSNRAVIGNSTGGYCALKFALRKPDSYPAAAALSGYYNAAHDETTGDLFGSDDRLKQENDLLWRLKNQPAAPVSLLLTTSYDEDNYGETQAMVKAFKAPTKLSTITLDSGGHNFHTWTREIPPAMEWLGSHLTMPPSA